MNALAPVLPSITVKSPEGAAWEFLVLFLVVIIGPPLLEHARLPGIVGLLLGGYVIGSHGFNLIGSGNTTVPELGQLGLLYLMFVAGVELDLALVRIYRGDRGAGRPRAARADDDEPHGPAGLAAKLAARIAGKNVERRSGEPATFGDLRPGQLCIAPAHSWQMLAASDPPVGAALMMVLDSPPPPPLEGDRLWAAAV